MCMKNSEEGCILSEQNKQLAAKVENMDVRLTKVEVELGSVRSETQEGFRQGAEAMRALDLSLSNLAHDFGDRMNNLDKRMVAEKEKWGEVLRSIVRWSARILLSGAAVAMGVTAWKNLGM